MKLVLHIALVFVVTGLYGQRDSLVCEANYASIGSWKQNFYVLSRQMTVTWDAQPGDSIRYVVFQGRRSSYTLSAVNSSGLEVVTPQTFREVYRQGIIQPVQPGTHVVKIRSRSMIPNTVVLTVSKRNCTYVERKKKPDPPPAPKPVWDTTLVLDSTFYLAATMNLKSRQQFRMEVDSLADKVLCDVLVRQGAVRFSLQQVDGALRWSGQGDKISRADKLLPGKYDLWVWNDDRITGKHVHVKIRKISAVYPEPKPLHP